MVDFYALDLLGMRVTEPIQPDLATSGSANMRQAFPGIFGGISRIRQTIDRTVGASAAKRPASGTAGSGGYTFGDLERWWALAPQRPRRRRDLAADNGICAMPFGRNAALKIVTGGMRLSPNAPACWICVTRIPVGAGQR